MKDPYKDLRYHINVIKEEGLYPIAEFCIKTTLRLMNFLTTEGIIKQTTRLWKK